MTPTALAEMNLLHLPLTGIPEELNRRIQSLIKDVEKMNYHISVGCDTGLYSEINIDSLIKNTEKRMYDDKTRFYQQKGIDRRVRMYKKSLCLKSRGFFYTLSGNLSIYFVFLSRGYILSKPVSVSLIILS